MFDRDQAIAAWRERLSRSGSFFESDLDELEEHVRDHLDALAEVGLEGEKAFDIALERIGEVAALAGEYAKVNRMLAWRTPLSWMGTGALALVVATPLYRTMLVAVPHLCAALGMSAGVLRAIVWALTLGTPLAFFAAMFKWAETSGEERFAWARSAPRRIAVLVACASIPISAMVAPYMNLWGDHAVMEKVHGIQWEALEVVSWGTPCAIAAYAFGVRIGAPEETHGATSWLALGFLSVFAGQEIVTITRMASIAGAGTAHVGFVATSAIVWLGTLATPAFILACGAKWLLRRSPDVLRGRGFMAALVGCCAIPIVGPLVWSPLYMRALRTCAAGQMLEGFRAEQQARFIVTSLLVIAIGGFLLRSRTAVRAR